MEKRSARRFGWLGVLLLFRTAMSIGLARASSILFFIVSARVYSVEDNASVILAITLPQLVVQIGTLGWLPVVRREISRIGETPSALVKGFVLYSTHMVSLSMGLIVIGVLVFAIAGSQAAFFACVALLMLLYAAVFMCREYLLALNYPAFGIFAAEALPFILGSLGMWIVRPEPLELTLLLFAGGLLCSLVIQLPLISSRIRPCWRAVSEMRRREWTISGLYSLLGFGGRAVMDRLDVIVLSSLTMAAELAVYNSAQRVSSLLLLPALVVLPVFSSRISRAFSAGEWGLVRRDIALQMAVVGVTTLPLAAVLLVFPAEINSFLFGERYAAADEVTWLIVLSQVMFAFSLPWGGLFLMTNRERLYGGGQLLAMLLALAVAFLLVAGIGGLAVAAASMVANLFVFAVFLGAGLRYLGREGRG